MRHRAQSAHAHNAIRDSAHSIVGTGTGSGHETIIIMDSTFVSWQAHHVHPLADRPGYALVHFPSDLPDSSVPDPTASGSAQAPLSPVEDKETHRQTLCLPSPYPHDNILHHWTGPACIRIHPSYAKCSISLYQAPASLCVCLLGVAQHDHKLLLGHVSVSWLLC